MPTLTTPAWQEKFTRQDGNWSVYFAIILVGMFAIGQLVTPFIAHDDFDWLNFQFDQGFETPWSKTFSEGRWLNFPWSFISHYLSIRGAVVLHLVTYSGLVWLMARLLSGRRSVIAALLLFVAPMAAESSLWPVTQVTGAFISLVACWGMLQSTRERDRLTWLAGGVFLGYLCYPSFGPVLMLLAATRIVDAKSAVRLAIVYVSVFIVAVLFVFLLNAIFHGAFTIQPSGWRGATPLLKDGTLSGNVERYLAYYRQLATLWPVFVVSAVGYAICIWRGTRRLQCACMLALGVMLLCMDAALSIISGLELWLRASLWMWIVLCAPIVFLIGSAGRQQIMGVVLALPLLAIGATAWSNMFQNVRHAFPAAQNLANEVAIAQAGYAGAYDAVVLYGDVHDSALLRHLHSNRALRNLLFKEYGWYTTPCSPELCGKIESELAGRQELPRWLVVDRTFVIIVSRNRGDLY